MRARVRACVRACVRVCFSSFCFDFACFSVASSEAPTLIRERSRDRTVVTNNCVCSLIALGVLVSYWCLTPSQPVWLSQGDP